VVETYQVKKISQVLLMMN